MEFIWNITGIRKTGATGVCLWLFAAMFLISLAAGPLSAHGATYESPKPETVPASHRSMEEPPAPPQTTEIDYTVIVTEQSPNGRLVLDCTLDRAPGESTLHLLGDKIYMDNDGDRYSLVVINWNLKHRPDAKTPWARTNMTKNVASFKIMK